SVRDCDVFECACDVWNVFTFEVTCFGDVVVIAKARRGSLAEHVAYLLNVPDEEFSFVTFRVGVLSRIKATFRMSHLAQHVVENALDCRARLLVTAYLEIVKIET